MKVSVVVPVFNTGPAIEVLIDSLRAQTLPTTEWEAVFVDDGSSDGTADLLDGLIATDPNMRLLREAPSGWPGRPRNVGMDAAAGDYVFFSDDDDTLGPEALERMTDFAIAHDADVVVPRTVGRNRGVPTIGRTVLDAQDRPGLIMSSLAPQKLFRTAFLRAAGIRFVEGRVRLEDHRFVVTAYLRAKRVSTYADYPCYTLAYKPGRPHISQQRPDWHAYFDSVRACLDLVDAEAREPAIGRAMRGRWLRSESLSRLRGDSHAKLATPELLHEVRQLLIDRYDESELDDLKPVDRMVASLLLAGRDDDIAALARWESSLEVRSEVTAARIDPDGTVRLELSSTLVMEEPVPGTSRAVLDQVSTFARVGVELQHVGTKVRRPLAVTHEPDGRTVAALAAGGEPLPAGRWTVVALAGEHRSRRRRPVDAAATLRLDAAARRVGARTMDLVGTGRFAVRVREEGAAAPGSIVAAVRRRVGRLLRSGAQIPRLRHHHG